jgi:hypothetical protein
MVEDVGDPADAALADDDAHARMTLLHAAVDLSGSRTFAGDLSDFPTQDGKHELASTSEATGRTGF